jgi:hypothetical protein
LAQNAKGELAKVQVVLPLASPGDWADAAKISVNRKAMLAGGNPKKMNKRRAMAAVFTDEAQSSRWYDLQGMVQMGALLAMILTLALSALQQMDFWGKNPGIKAGHKYITIHK